MRPRHQPVSLGSISARTVVASSAIVTDIFFPPGSKLERHTHERAILGVMLDGVLTSEIARRTLVCDNDSVWIEPRGEPHANDIGSRGARLLAIQPDPSREEVFEGVQPFLERIHLQRCAGFRVDALRLNREVHGVQDAVTSLAIDSLVIQLMVTAARHFFRSHQQVVPPWLLRVRDMLHDLAATPPQLDVLSKEAGVSTSHLSHSFKHFFRMTPGEYVRQVRAANAAHMLRNSDTPIAEVALLAGYCDQPHLTRDMVRCFGSTPAAMRDALRKV